MKLVNPLSPALSSFASELGRQALLLSERSQLPRQGRKKPEGQGAGGRPSNHESHEGRS